MKNDKRKKEIFRWIFLGGLFVVCDFSCFYAVNTRMSGLIYVPSTDIDDGGKTSHRWSLFSERVPARCQLEFVRKVDVSYRQSFFEHHSFFID